jgi:hypothetical protein
MCVRQSSEWRGKGSIHFVDRDQPRLIVIHWGFAPDIKSAYAMPMGLRILLRVVIAIGLLLQGVVGSTAAFASDTSGHHCHSTMSHDGQAPKCPCCPAKSFVSCADACMTVAALPAVTLTFNLPLISISPPIERTRLVAAPIDALLRPPIA